MTHVAGVAPDSYRDSGYPSRILAWTTVILLLSAYAVSLVDRQILSLLIEPVRRHFEITDTQISLLAGIAFVIFYTLLGLPFGRWADTGNRRNIVVAGMLLWCVATVCCGLAGNLLTLFLARMLVGVGEAALGPSAYSLIADSFPPGPRARAISVYTTGVFLGTGSAPVFGAAAVSAASRAADLNLPIVGQLEGWQTAFVLVGVPGLLVAVLIALIIREPVRHGQSAGRAPWTTTIRHLGSRGGAPLMLIIAFALNGLVNYGLITWVPSLFIRQYGWKAASIGSTYGLILMLAGSAGVLTGGWLASRKNRADWPIVISRWAMLAIFVLLLSFGASSTPVGTLVLLGLLAYLIGIPAALAPVAIFEITPNEMRGQFSALYLLGATLLGLGFGVTAIAAVKDYVLAREDGLGLAMTIVLALSALLAHYLLRLAERRVLSVA